MIEHRRKEKNFISAVIYVHNNAAQINKYLPKFYSFFEDRFEAFELIIVDDCSTDGSAAQITSLFETYQSQAISLIHMSHYQGAEASIIAGVDYAIGDYVVEFDTLIMDYDMEVVMQSYQKCLEGYDIVTASPDVTKLSSRLFYAMFNAHSRINYKLGTERFRILSRRAINRISSLSVSIMYRKAVYYTSGLNSFLLKYTSIDKQLSKTIRSGFSERVGLAFKSLLLFTDIVVRMAFYLALGMFLFSVAIAIYALTVKLVYQGVVEGWTTLMLFLAVSFSGIFVLMAFLIKYVSLNFDLNNQNKNYIYSSFEKITGRSS